MIERTFSVSVLQTRVSSVDVTVTIHAVDERRIGDLENSLKDLIRVLTEINLAWEDSRLAAARADAGPAYAPGGSADPMKVDP